MTPYLTTSTASAAIQRSLLACGLLLGLTGCPDDDHSGSVGLSGLSASLIQQAYLKASNTGTADHFGYAVALDGDTLVVGVLDEDSNETGVSGTGGNDAATNSGAVYVFTRSGNAWSQQAYLKASNTGANDAFGQSLALSGDTLVVGAIGEDSNETGTSGLGNDNTASASGAAYVFTRSGGVWSQQAYLKASNTGANDAFGQSLALSGDTLVVGAIGEDSNETGTSGLGGDNTASASGAVYVFTRSGSAWSQQAYLKASNTEANDEFGWSVALSGDTVVVGARGEDSNETGTSGLGNDNTASASGAAYVFTRSGSAWTQQAYLKASNTGANDEFGWSLALSGDTLVVGAIGEDSNETGTSGLGGNNAEPDSGAAYVFTRNGSVWTQQAYLKASNTEANDYFGWSVALSGDTLVVGAYEESSNATGVDGDQINNGATGSGAVYVFTRSGGVWSQQSYVKASNTEPHDLFGFAVAVSGNTVAVGANSESSSAIGVNGAQGNGSNNSGAVYVFQ